MESKGAPPPYDPQFAQAPQQPGWNPGYTQSGPPPANIVIQPAVTTQPAFVTTTPVVLVGGCPGCRVGILQESYGCCAIFLAIFFFPIGILCCLAMREKRCSNCGATF